MTEVENPEVENLQNIIKTDFNKFKQSTISKINEKLKNKTDITSYDFQLTNDIKYIKFDITNISADLIDINESKNKLKHNHNQEININLKYQMNESINSYIVIINNVKTNSVDTYNSKITTFVQNIINNGSQPTELTGNKNMEDLYTNLKSYYDIIQNYNYEQKVLYILYLLSKLNNDINKEHLIHFFLFDKNDKLVTQIINSIIDDTKNVKKTNFITSIFNKKITDISLFSDTIFDGDGSLTEDGHKLMVKFLMKHHKLDDNIKKDLAEISKGDDDYLHSNNRKFIVNIEGEDNSYIFERINDFKVIKGGGPMQLWEDRQDNKKFKDMYTILNSQRLDNNKEAELRSLYRKKQNEFNETLKEVLNKASEDTIEDSLNNIVNNIKKIVPSQDNLSTLSLKPKAVRALNKVYTTSNFEVKNDTIQLDIKYNLTPEDKEYIENLANKYITAYYFSEFKEKLKNIIDTNLSLAKTSPSSPSSQPSYKDFKEIEKTVDNGNKFYEIYKPGAEGEKQTDIADLYYSMYNEYVINLDLKDDERKNKDKYINGELAKDEDFETYYRTLDAYYIAFVKKDVIVKELNNKTIKMQIEPYDSTMSDDKRNENVRIVNEIKYLSKLNDDDNIKTIKRFLENYSIMVMEAADEGSVAEEAVKRAAVEAGTVATEVEGAADRARLKAGGEARARLEAAAKGAKTAATAVARAMVEKKGAARTAAVGMVEEAKEDTNKLNKFLIIYLFFIFYYDKDGSKYKVPKFNYLLKLPLYHLKILNDNVIKIAKKDNTYKSTLSEILETDSLKHKDCLVNMVTTIHAYYIYKKLCCTNVYHGSIDKEKLLDLTDAKLEVFTRRTVGGTQKNDKYKRNKTRSRSSGNYNKTKRKCPSNNNTRKK